MPLCYTLFVFSIVAGSKAVKSDVACTVCGVLHETQAKWCLSCRKIIGRIDTRAKHNKKARLAALKRAWGGSAFYCEITGWKLTTTNSESPFYLTWEHLTPGDEKDVIVAAALVNRMKANLTLDQFKVLVCALAKRFSNHRGTIPKIKPQRRQRPVKKNMKAGGSVGLPG